MITTIDHAIKCTTRACFSLCAIIHIGDGHKEILVVLPLSNTRTATIGGMCRELFIWYQNTSFEHKLAVNHDILGQKMIGFIAMHNKSHK